MSQMHQALYELQEMDELAMTPSPIHHLFPLSKFFVTIGYILTVMSFPKYALGELIVMVVYPVLVSMFSGIPLSIAFRKLKYIFPLVIAVGVFDPLIDRQMIGVVGRIPITAGMISMMGLMVKGVLCLLATFLFVATTVANELFVSLRQLHIPKIFVTLLLLTWRFVSVLIEEANTMMDAYYLRAPNQKGLHYKTWGSFVGQLLLRTMDRSQELYDAMLLRGYTGEYPTNRIRKSNWKDWGYCLAWIGCFYLIRNYPINEMIGMWVIK